MDKTFTLMLPLKPVATLLMEQPATTQGEKYY